MYGLITCAWKITQPEILCRVPAVHTQHRLWKQDVKIISHQRANGKAVRGRMVRQFFERGSKKDRPLIAAVEPNVGFEE
jgi:hypothetical protein